MSLFISNECCNKINRETTNVDRKVSGAQTVKVSPSALAILLSHRSEAAEPITGKYDNMTAQ